MIRWLLAALLVAGQAHAQCIGFQCPTHQSVAKGYVLDGLSAPTGAYSLRRLLTSYSTNKLVNLRRTSDSATTDIGFTATGAIDTATASTFCAATTCFVTKWYDQSGNGRDISQATAGSQPAFIFNCLDTNPCVRFTAGTQNLLSGAFTPATGVDSFSVVANRSSGSGACVLLRANTNAKNHFNTGAAGTWKLFGSSGSVTATATDVAWHAATAVLNDTSSLVNVDGVTTTGTATGDTTVGSIGIIGASSTCNILSSILWDNTALSAAAQTVIGNSQRAWWGF